MQRNTALCSVPAAASFRLGSRFSLVPARQDYLGLCSSKPKSCQAEESSSCIYLVSWHEATWCEEHTAAGADLSPNRSSSRKKRMTLTKSELSGSKLHYP